MWIITSSTPQTVSTSYRKGYFLAVCDISYVGPGVWYINRVNVPESIGRSKGIGSKLLQRAIKEIKEKYSPVSIIVTPGGYSQFYERQVKFYKKNDFIETSQKGFFYYKELEEAYL